jgi:hypothetical protein
MDELEQVTEGFARQMRENRITDEEFFSVRIKKSDFLAMTALQRKDHMRRLAGLPPLNR